MSTFILDLIIYYVNEKCICLLIGILTVALLSRIIDHDPEFLEQVSRNWHCLSSSTVISLEQIFLFININNSTQIKDCIDFLSVSPWLSSFPFESVCLSVYLFLCLLNFLLSFKIFASFLPGRSHSGYLCRGDTEFTYSCWYVASSFFFIWNLFIGLQIFYLVLEFLSF